MSGTVAELLRRPPAEYEAARQYVEAADHWRGLARAKRRAGLPVGRRDEIADRLMAEARDALAS